MNGLRQVTLALAMLLGPLAVCGVSFGASPSPRSAPSGSRGGSTRARPAGVVSLVSVNVVDDGVRILLRSDVPLLPQTVEYARDLPPRLVIDLPGVRPGVRPVTRVGRLGVERVRVGTNSVSPLVTRVVLDLARRLPYRVLRGGNRQRDLVIVLGNPSTGPATTPAATKGSPQPPTSRAAPPRVAAASSAPVRKTAAAATSTPRARTLFRITADTVDARVQITLRGDGRLEPRIVEYARDLPPRLLIDLPGVNAATPPTIRVGRLGVERVRVGTNSVSPLVTRVVLDLSQRLPFEVARAGQGGKDLVILFGGAPITSADAEAATEDADPLHETIASTAPQGAETPGASSESSDTVAPWMLSIPRSAPGHTPVDPPDPTSEVDQADGGSGLFGLRSFRAALGVGYDLVGTEVRNGEALSYTSRTTSPLVTLLGTLWLIDPQIVTIHALADLRFDRQRYSSDVLDSRTADGLQNYRVNLSLLSGRGSPLSVYLERTGFSLDQRQSPTSTGEIVTLSQVGRQSSRGFSWDLNNPRLPHVAVAGSLTDRRDFGSFLSGWDSTSRQERFELRADKDARRFRYDVSYAHDKSRFVYPLATLATSYGVDVVRGTTALTPRPGFTVTAGARLTTFGAGRTTDRDQQQNFTGAGGNTGLEWRWSPRWRLEANYNMSTNESLLALSQVKGPDSAATSSPGLDVSVRRRFLYQDVNGRVTYTSRDGSIVAAAFLRGLSLDPVSFGTPTLDTLTIAGGRLDYSRTAAGLDLTLGAEAAGGPSSSNRGDNAPYHELSGRAHASMRLAPLTVSASGGIRDTGGSYFYPVDGQSWHGELEVAYDVSRQFQLQGSASRSSLLRDVVFQRGDDRTETYRTGLRGPRFSVAFEQADTRSTTTGLLETALLAEADPAVLLGARPELFGFLYASRQLRRALDVHVTPLRGLDLFARGRVDRLEFPDANGGNVLDQKIGQAGVVWGLRQLQIEIGCEYMDYWSRLVGTVDRRFHVRIRRDLVVR